MVARRNTHAPLISASVDEVLDWLAGITYKDGVSIVPELGEQYTGIVIRLREVDSRALAGEEPVVVTHRFALPARSAVRDRESFVGWLRQTLGRVELHERDEWLLVDGRRLFDPHAL